MSPGKYFKLFLSSRMTEEYCLSPSGLCMLEYSQRKVHFVVENDIIGMKFSYPVAAHGVIVKKP